jgi:hypothetical protein
MWEQNLFDPNQMGGNPQKQNEDLWKDIINPEPILERIELTLQGYTLDSNTWAWKKQYPSLLNDQGLGILMYFLRNLISKNIIMANLKEDSINLRCKHNRNDLIAFLSKNYEAIGLNKQYLSLVLNTIDDNMSSIFSRGKDATQLKYLSTSTKRLESYSVRPDQNQNKGFMGMNLFKGA